MAHLQKHIVPPRTGSNQHKPLIRKSPVMSEGGKARQKSKVGRVGGGERGIRGTPLRASEPANARSHAGIRAGEEGACARSSRRTPDAMQRGRPGGVSRSDGGGGGAGTSNHPR